MTQMSRCCVLSNIIQNERKTKRAENMYPEIRGQDILTEISANQLCGVNCKDGADIQSRLSDYIYLPIIIAHIK